MHLVKKIKHAHLRKILSNALKLNKEQNVSTNAANTEYSLAETCLYFTLGFCG